MRVPIALIVAVSITSITALSQTAAAAEQKGQGCDVRGVKGSGCEPPGGPGGKMQPTEKQLSKTPNKGGPGPTNPPPTPGKYQ